MKNHNLEKLTPEIREKIMFIQELLKTARKRRSKVYQKLHRLQNRDFYLKYRAENARHRTKTDLNFKLASNLRHRLWSFLKNGSHVKDLGCSLEELRSYLESKFSDGMSWDNYGIKGWHIDHIRPLSKFDLKDREQFLTACHFTNLQPMWAADNIRKSNT
jgi:hypothetical protein